MRRQRSGQDQLALACRASACRASACLTSACRASMSLSSVVSLSLASVSCVLPASGYAELLLERPRDVGDVQRSLAFRLARFLTSRSH